MMIKKAKLVVMLLAPMTALILSFNQPLSNSNVKSGIDLPGDSVVSLVQQAYIFGYPMMMMAATKDITTNVAAPVPNKAAAPVNQFGHFRTFPDASFKEVVKPNCDTYYSSAWLDLKPEPLVLSVPNTNGRYYLLPMLDAYTNVFASPGKRTTGTAAGNFLITGPDFTGTIPNGMNQIKAPTNLVWIAGRTQTNSREDGATVVKTIQDGYQLTPLSKWGTAYTPEKHLIDTGIAKVPPPFLVENMDIERFMIRLNKLITLNPPATMDAAILNKLSAIGVGVGKQFNLASYDQETQKRLKAIPAAIHKKLREAGGKVGVLENGWNVTRVGFGSYGTNYLQRAMIALVALGANLNADACYPNCQVDENGEKLNGSKKYIIHFDKGQTPPAHAFWSVTVYGPDDYLVANPINRFAIGDRDKLTYNKDGSMDIYIQNENPGNYKEANWLPSGKDGFILTMRIYWPKDEFINGSWKIPPVKVVNE